MILIPAGKAVFGDSRSCRFEAELPAYHLGRFCVTITQYVAFLNSVRMGRGWRFEYGVSRQYGHLVERGRRFAVEDPGRYGDHPALMTFASLD